MRVERLNDRAVVRLSMLDYGQCFSNEDDSTVYMLTQVEKPSTLNDGSVAMMAVDVENGWTHWLNESKYVKPILAKVVVEW